MKLHTAFFIAISAVMLSGGCVEDELMQGVDAPQPADVESPLKFDVRAFTVCGGTRASEPSPDPEPETEEERKIENFWLFQFKQDGTQLAVPKYYSIPADGVTLNELTAKAYNGLTTNTPMTIYVVTNVGDKWPEVNTLITLKQVKEAAIPSPYPIRVMNDETRNDKLLIPMSGQVDDVTKTDKSLIVVPVTRMYAKIKIQAKFDEVEGMRMYDVTVDKIPYYSSVEPANGFDSEAAVSLAGKEFINRAFNSLDLNTENWVVIYVPENLQGEVEGINGKTPADAPADALTVYIRAKYKENNFNAAGDFDPTDFDFTVYPGENSKNNFNVRRNRVYRVTVDVRNATDQHKPSSNSFVVKPHSKVTFEPYYRTETGGGYNISDYLDPNDPKKRIDTTEIIWQNQGTIGDNTDGSKVKFQLNEEDPIHSKLTVYTGNEGNALIGARNNETGEIVWSWHIWVTNNEPDNFRDAIVFKTYDWNSSGIKNTAPRIPGYGVMPCNLGALAYTPKNYNSVDFDTYGMMYQWGRKDPFPPFRKTTGKGYSDGWIDYTNANTGNHYGNDNSTIVGKARDNMNALFHTVLQSSSIINTTKVKYGIAHPTVYIAATTSLSDPPKSTDGLFSSGPDPSKADYGKTNGNWCPDEVNSDLLWGGLKYDDNTMDWLEVGTMKKTGLPAYMYDNYGSEKSIFDPCPTGWRVAPPDLWLGFTETGENPANNTKMDQVNYDSSKSSAYGLTMYMREWRGNTTVNNPTSYFPTQGTLGVNGKGYHVGVCGNYHNATCGKNDRVNILHIHDDSNLGGITGALYGQHFHIFELEYINYYVKSTAGPVRCVRDRK